MVVWRVEMLAMAFAIHPIKYKYAVTFMEVELNSHTVLLP